MAVDVLAQTVNDLTSLRGGSHEDGMEVSEEPILRNAAGSCGVMAALSAVASANKPRKRGRPALTTWRRSTEADSHRKPKLTLWATAEDKQESPWQRQGLSNCSWTWYCGTLGLERLPPGPVSPEGRGRDLGPARLPTQKEQAYAHHLEHRPDQSHPGVATTPHLA